MSGKIPKVSKPRWYKKPSTHYKTAVNRTEKAQYGAHIDFNTVNSSTIQVSTEQRFSPADLKEFGLACYHLGLWLEQNGH